VGRRRQFIRGKGGKFVPSTKVNVYGRKEEKQMVVPTRVYGRLERRSYDWGAVSSSNIRMIKYDNDREELSVEFISGKRAIYYDVPFEVFEEFYYSRSKGTFFYYEIRMKGYDWNYI